MSEMTKSENSFIGFEYKHITIKKSMEPIYTDAYSNFGYILEGTSAPIQRYGCVSMKFKRDRKIRNKVELTRLQRQFDSCVAEIENLERSKYIRASVLAYIISVVGTAFMAGSIFAYLADMLVLCIIFAIPAFAGWTLPYFCYKSIHRKKTIEINPLIDSKYDEIYEVCEKANSLI